MILNYFDLGLHKDAAEIDMFIKVCDENNIQYSVWGFEAHPNYCASLVEKYKNNKNVTIINKAIFDKNCILKLYLAPSNDGEGNSIFKTKNNVNVEKFIEVEGVLFSEWILNNVSNLETSNNILRYNIEGAEWYLMNDLKNKNLLKYFKIILGSTPDMIKISELKDFIPEYDKLLDMNDIKVHKFTKCQPKTNCNLINLINKKFK